MRLTRLGYQWTIDTRFSSVPTSPFVVKVVSYDIFNIVSAPIDIGYSFVSKEKFSMHISGGIIFDGMLREYTKNRQHISDGSTKTERTTIVNFNKKPFNVSYNFSLGSYIKLNSQSGLKAELIYYQNIGAFNSDAVQLRLTAAMLNVGYVRAVSF